MPGRATVVDVAATDSRPPPTDTRAGLGALGEQIAVRYLTDAGLAVLDRNWRSRRGELDVVARDGDALVFCEVKARRGTGYGVPAAAVTALVGLAVAVAAALRGRRAQAVVACALTALLISPVSWSHHWVWCVPLVLLVW